MIEKQIPDPQSKNVVPFPLGKKQGLRIIFMGTPEFAVASLDKLVHAGYNIVGVITAPDKPGGRGMELQQSAVKKYAVDHHLNFLQPEKLKSPEFLQELKSLQADVQIVVAFRMLPEAVWDMPPLGTINLHGSLLPQYRGAAPINWAIINGENYTGVTTFKLQHAIDTGNILLAEKINIDDDETAGELHDKMKEVGAGLLLKTLKGMEDGSLKETAQESIVNSEWSMGEITDDQKNISGVSPFTTPHSQLYHAPKIFTETCQVDFTKSMDEVYNLVRGLSPYPTAFTFLKGKKLKVYKVDKVNKKPVMPAGEIETDGKTFLRFACSNGYISVKELQLEGKKKMNIEDFLRGYQFT
ncbi:MAG: methionyl-tRNA formyltransferase [Ferruginibacter sp.]